LAKSQTVTKSPAATAVVDQQSALSASASSCKLQKYGKTQQNSAKLIKIHHCLKV